jgi:hypothetical protein
MGQRQKYPIESWLGCWAGNISLGKMLLAGNEHQSGGEIRGNYVASVVLLFLETVEYLEDLSTEAQGLARVTVKTTGSEVRTPWWGSFGEWPTEGSLLASQTLASGSAPSTMEQPFPVPLCFYAYPNPNNHVKY